MALTSFFFLAAARRFAFLLSPCPAVGWLVMMLSADTVAKPTTELAFLGAAGLFWTFFFA